MRPDRFALDILLEGPTPVESSAIFADVWNFIDPHSELHGQPQQRVTFGLINPPAHPSATQRPRLRVYSTNPAFSAALATQLLTTREIVIGRKPYRIVGQAAVPHLDAEYVDAQTPIIIKEAKPNPNNPRRPFTRCVPYHESFFHERLQTVMRQKLWDCGFHEKDLPQGPLITMVAGRHKSVPLKERPVYLFGAVGRWQLHGSPEVRRCLILSGLGVKTGMGFGFVVPAA
jgi:CRISPR-associated endoribonuclease Cas6